MPNLILCRLSGQIGIYEMNCASDYNYASDRVCGRFRQGHPFRLASFFNRFVLSRQSQYGKVRFSNRDDSKDSLQEKSPFKAIADDCFTLLLDTAIELTDA